VTDRSHRQATQLQLHENFWVEASAGSGKTQCLTDRIIHGLRTQAYLPQHVAAVTFTRKAAAELRLRVRWGLESQAPSQVLEQFDQIFIGTIHSFCAHLLRLHPIQAGLATSFRELSEQEESKLLHEGLRGALESQDGNALLRSLADYEADGNDLLPALQWMTDQGEVDFPTDHVSLPELQPIWEQLWKFRDELRPQLPPAEPDATCAILRASLRFPAGRTPGPLKELLHRLGPWESELKPVKRYWGSDRTKQDLALAPVVSLTQDFRQRLVGPVLRQVRAHLYNQVVPFLKRVRQKLALNRHQRGVLSHNDLLHSAVKLLRDHEGARKSLQARFRHLLVDEFQDTDPLQAELFWQLAGTDKSGSLFLVGDPKQSIYRFRRADIQLILQLKGRMEKTGAQICELSSSYRSRPALCRWLNQAFSQILPRLPTAEQACHSPLNSQLAESEEPAVMQLLAHSLEDEALQLAAGIQQRVIEQKSHQYGDFLVLTARKAEIQLFRKTFEDHLIPCEAPQERGLLGARAASLLPLLHHLADPQDKAILVGVLRGPLFGHSDEELFLHVQAAGTLRPYPPGPGHPSVCATLVKLDRWRLAVRWLPAGAAVSWLMKETGVWALALAEGRSSVAQLRGLVDCMRRCSELGMTLAEAVADVTSKGSLELPSGRYAQRNAVRILNIHKAKGLQARVVFLAAPVVGFSSQIDQLVTPERRGAFSLRKWRRPVAQPLNWDELEQQERTYLEAEHRRLLYVASTRARETLVVSRVWKRGNGPWQVIEPFLQDCPQWEFYPLAAPETPGREPVAPAAVDALRIPTWQRARATSRHSFLKPTLPAPELNVDAGDWGRLVHRLLEYRVRHPHAGREEWLRVGHWFCYEVPTLLGALDAALDAVEGVNHSLLWDWVRSADKRLVEVPLAVRSGRRCIFGTIDLALQRDKGWGLVDYKTDRQQLDTLVSHYAHQIEQYAKTWREVICEPLRYSGIFAVREGQLSLNLTPP